MPWLVWLSGLTYLVRGTKYGGICKKIDIILLHSQWIVTVALAVIILFDNLGGKRSVPLTKVKYCIF